MITLIANPPNPALWPGGYLYREIRSVGGTCRAKRSRKLHTPPRIISLPETFEGAMKAGSLCKRGVAALRWPLPGHLVDAFYLARGSDSEESP